MSVAGRGRMTKRPGALEREDPRKTQARTYCSGPLDVGAYQTRRPASQQLRRWRSCRATPRAVGNMYQVRGRGGALEELIGTWGGADVCGGFGGTY